MHLPFAPRPRRAAPRAGFTLMELMLVVAVIGILMGMLGAAAYSARQRAYKAKATAETQQIAAAFKSYWIARNQWPSGFGSGWTDLTRKNLGPLLGDGDDGVVYLNVPPDQFEGDDKAFCDPWGHPYQVRIDDIKETLVSDTYEGAVSFPNAMRHYYEDGVYDRPASEWDWDDYK